MFDAPGTGATLAPERSSRPPLGQLLVERGFIGEEQLDFALSEHERTGLPLGQVLIGLSYVTAATMAQALATQHGGLLKTEYGFGTGFDATMNAVDEVPAPNLALAETAVAPLEIAEPQPEPVVETVSEPMHEPMPEPVPVVVPAPVAFVAPEPLPGLDLVEAQRRIAELVELAVASARRETGATRQDTVIAKHEAEIALQDADAARRDLAASREDAEAARSSADAIRRELAAARVENEACALKVQQLQAELAMTTENLRNAYARLHQFEIAQALQQAQPAPQVQHAAPAQDARPASPYTWQS